MTTDHEDRGFLKSDALAARLRVYEPIANILKRLGIIYALDCGCSYGLLVELLNSRGIDARGVDFGESEIREYHANLQCSRGKFYYGDVTALDIQPPETGSAVTLLDCLRYIPRPSRLSRLQPEYILIKEVSNNAFMRSSRRGEFERRLYSPLECSSLFPEYRVTEIHASRFIFRISRPGSSAMQWLNMMPTYTVVLHRVT